MTHLPPNGGQPPNPGGQPPHFDPNQPPPTQPQSTEPGPHMQQPMQQPMQPPMGAPMGGQPPMGPPPTNMGYGYPPPPPKKGNGGKIVLASVLALALVAGIGGFFIWTNVLRGGPDPAETLPASSAFYMEVNLDPSFDQTPKVLSLMNRSDEFDLTEERDQAIIELFSDHGDVDFDPDEDLVSWMGNRGAVGAWFHDDEPYFIMSLASTDDSAAEEGMQNIIDSIDGPEDEVAFDVSDNSMVAVIGEDNAASALESLQSEVDSSPISEEPNYSEAMDWLEGDQLVTLWADTENFPEEAMEEAFGDEEFFEFDDFASGNVAMGVRAFDDGLEVQYRSFSDEDAALPGDDQLLDRMGEMPAAPIAAGVSTPDDLPQRVDDVIDALEEMQGELGGFEEDPWDDNSWEEPLTESEYLEWEQLAQMYEEDFMDMSGDELTRFHELDLRHELYGVEGEGAGMGGGDLGDDLRSFFDIIAGAQVTFAMDADVANENASIDISANLQDGKGVELQQWLMDMGVMEPGQEDGTLDGDTFTLSEGEFSQGPLSEDSRFSDMAENAPDNASVALWVDFETFAEGFDEAGVNEAAPVSLVTWIHGAEGSDDAGVLRLYFEE